MAPHTRSKWHITDEKEKEKEAKEKEHMAVEKEPVTEPMQVDKLEQSTISETADTSGRKRKTRGASFYPNLVKKKVQGIRTPVTLNNRGQFVGDSGVELQNYTALIVRQIVSLSILNWSKVPHEMKTKVWEQVLVSVHC